MSEIWPDPKAAWKNEESFDWMTKVIQGLPHQSYKTHIHYDGPCPRCGHRITVDVPRPADDLLVYDEAFEGVKDDGDGKGDETPKTSIPADGRSPCNCREGHTGTGAQPTGCGIYGYAFL